MKTPLFLRQAVRAILGAAMGAAMTGLKPIAEIMFSDFFAVCFDYIANEFPKSRYMSNGQLKCPLVVRTGSATAVAICTQKLPAIAASAGKPLVCAAM